MYVYADKTFRVVTRGVHRACRVLAAPCGTGHGRQKGETCQKRYTCSHVSVLLEYVLVLVCLRKRMGEDLINRAKCRYNRLRGFDFVGGQNSPLTWPVTVNTVLALSLPRSL